jgi:DNA replication protein DnaC
MKQLSLLGFHKNMENLIILGRTGEGKIYLAISLGKRLCAEGITTLFYSVNLFFEEVNAAKTSGKYFCYNIR